MNKNEQKLKEFTEFCKQHPELRFFQALSVWQNCHTVYLEKYDELLKDYYCEDMFNVE